MTEQRNNLAGSAAPSVILSGDACRASDTAKEGRGPHRPSDLEITEIIGEVEKSIPKFDLRDIFADVHGLSRKPTLLHSGPLPRVLSTTERFGIAPFRLNKGNTINALVAVNHFGFRRTVVALPTLGVTC